MSSQLTPRTILEAIEHSSRGWPKIFRSFSHQPAAHAEASVPDALESAFEHVKEAEKVFAKLADECIPRGREDEIREVIELLTEARREVSTSQAIVESIWSILRPWQRKSKGDT